MQRLIAIAHLTWKAAFRFRLFWVLLLLLLVAVVALPLLVKDDGTARGFTQILLTYNLSVITALMGLSTLWVGCGTLARDIEECQMQMVAVKPISRWQIWLGKWLGIMALNAALLALAGGSVYALLLWRAQHLPEAQQKVLRQEIFVARGTLKEPLPDIEAAVERLFRERLRETPVPEAEHRLLRNQLREMIKAGVQLVPPGFSRRWEIDLGARKNLLRGQPLFLRVKFNAARTNLTGTYLGLWQVGVPDKTPFWREPKSMAADTFHEFAVPPNLFEENGKLTIFFENHDTVPLLFPLEDGFEVLYREGGFGLNYARGLCVILCWLALLTALGLASASLMSFPVAAFCSASLLVVALSSGTISRVVEEGTVLGVSHESGSGSAGLLDRALVPVFRGLLAVIHLTQGSSPVDALSTGRSISWEQLGLAFAKTVLLVGGVISLAGMVFFQRRELATAQTNV
jgi:hypothetical protein